jgi:uncharacterized protein YdaU (DUF1376 family)
MAKIRRIDFSPDEFLTGVSNLAHDEIGPYWVACCLMYSRGGAIEDDDVWVAKACGAHVRTWRAIKARLVAKGKLQIEGGFITNRRALTEIGKAQGRVKGAREAAEASAKARRERAENAGLSNDYNDIPEAPAHISDEANHQPSTTNYQIDIKQPSQEAAPAPPPPDTATIIFGQGREWLIRQSGKPDGACRGLLGKWRRDHGDAALIEALGAAQREGALEPVAFITKALQERTNGKQWPRNNDRVAGNSSDLDGVAAAFARRSFPPRR